jgi:hypothetical protein
MPTQMNLVEILLPVRDNAGVVFQKSSFERVKNELTGRFGGLTAFTRSPADGFWQDKSGTTHAEDVIAFEVMAESVDEGWWQDFRNRLETLFAQEEIVIRAHAIQRL